MNAMHILIRRAGKRMAVLKKYVLRSRAAALRRAGLLWRDASRWPAPTAIRKNLAPMAIALGGLLIAAGVFAFSGSNPENPVASRESPQWTQRTGAGLSVPACGSSSAGATCNNGAPVVDFIWTNTGDADESRICQSARIGTWVAGQDPGTAVRIGDNLPCSGSFTWTGASAATNYNYVIRYKTAAFCIASDEFSGRCLTWETRTYPREETRCLNQGESGCEEWETYTNFGHLISEDAFSTLACALPTADIKANGSDEPIMIPYNTSATASWSSTNANSCTVSPTGWTGTSGSQSTGNLTSSQTYSLACSNPNGSASDSVTVNVEIQPPLHITVFGRVFNETTGQGFGGASIETCRGFTVTTAANGNFSFQVPQKDGFCARVTPETRAGLDGPFLNNNPSVDPSFRTYEWQIAGWHCASQGGCSADQNTWDRSTDGTYDFKYREQGSPTVTCSANPSTINAGESTTWRATASGGSGAYSFSWSDTTGRTTPGGNGSSNPNSWGPFSYSSGAGASVIVLDSNNKQGTNSCTVTVNPLPPTGDLEIKRVDQNLDPLPDEATKAKATGSYPLGIKPENPAFYDDISIGSYRSEATELAGYTETYGTCDTPGCLVMSFSPATCSGGWCSAGDQTVSDGALRRVVFKYTPPDLTIASGPAANGSLVVGTPVTFSGTVRNQEGGANITDTFPNRFRADLNRDGSYETTMTPNPMIAGLAAGATSPAITSGSWTPSTAGDYRIELCADTPSGVVTESNEANNCATSNVTVTSPTSFQCSDTVDNTDPEDTIADYPNDVGCTSPTDNDERNRCVDGIDNDNDGTVDNEDSPYLSGRQDDPGCTSTQDNSEANPPTFKEIPPT